MTCGGSVNTMQAAQDPSWTAGPGGGPRFWPALAPCRALGHVSRPTLWSARHRVGETTRRCWRSAGDIRRKRSRGDTRKMDRERATNRHVLPVNAVIRCEGEVRGDEGVWSVEEARNHEERVVSMNRSIRQGAMCGEVRRPGFPPAPGRSGAVSTCRQIAQRRRRRPHAYRFGRKVRGTLGEAGASVSDGRDGAAKCGRGPGGR